MQLVKSKQGDATVLTLTGRLDVEAATEFEETCRKQVQAGARTVLLNLTSLDYVSSAGLRAMLSVGKTLQTQEGKLVLVAAPGPVRQILEVAGLHKMFALCSTMAEAGRHTTGHFMVQMSKEWDTDIMTVYGRVDAEHAPEVEEAGRRVLQSGYLKLIINLSAVQYLSSAGLCALLNLGKLAKERKGRLFLCNPAPAVKEILKISGFDKLFPIRDSVADALTE